MEFTTFLRTYTMIYHFFMIKTLDTNMTLGVHGLIKLENTLNYEILQKVGKGEKVKDHSTDMMGGDPLLHEEEDGEISPIKNTLASIRVIPHYHDTSTQKSEMDLRSGSSNKMFPFVVHMGMSHETSLSCGIPLGRPPNSDLVKDFSCIDAPFMAPGGREHYKTILQY